MALTLQNLENQTRFLRNLVTDHPYAVGATALAIVLEHFIAKEYKAWYSIEAGGLPHTFYGFVLAKIAGTQNSPDLMSTSLYNKLMIDAVTSKRYMEDIPIRAGQAPVVTGWAVPVRQISAHADATHKKLLDDIIHNTVSTYKDQTLRAKSVQEGGKCDALWVRASAVSAASGKPTANTNRPIGTAADNSKVELYHYHEYDGSAHTTLAPADAKYLLDRGWGLRHPLSGQKLFGAKILLPATFVMVYAPRSEEETKVHAAVAKAAVEFALAGGL